jgi:TRAP-type mannitol/chloroaromatic compound transport system permease small subunit
MVSVQVLSANLLTHSILRKHVQCASAVTLTYSLFLFWCVFYLCGKYFLNNEKQV